MHVRTKQVRLESCQSDKTHAELNRTRIKDFSIKTSKRLIYDNISITNNKDGNLLPNTNNEGGEWLTVLLSQITEVVRPATYQASKLHAEILKSSKLEDSESLCLVYLAFISAHTEDSFEYATESCEFAIQSDWSNKTVAIERASNGLNRT